MERWDFWFRKETTLLLMELLDYGSRLMYACKLARLQPNQARGILAAELGITVQALGRVITGKNNSLSAENHMKAARFLKVDPWWLATGEGEPRVHGLSSEALDVAEFYDTLDNEHRKQFWLILHIVRPTPEEPSPPPAPTGPSTEVRPSLSRARENHE